MGDTTDELLDLAHQVSPLPPGRELDMLLTAGERISMALLAMAIHNLGYEARSYTGSQAGVITTSVHGGRGSSTSRRAGCAARSTRARSRSSPASRASRRTRRTSRRWAAAARTRPPSRWPRRSHADVCEIYTDVDGVFTADPRIVPSARHIKQITYEEMLELAACGAKVLMLRCVEYARRFKVPIHVRSSYSQKPGTIVTGSMEDLPVEQALITGVAHDRSEAKITIVSVPGRARRGRRDLRDRGRRRDQHRHDRAERLDRQAGAHQGRTDISFTLPQGRRPGRDGAPSTGCRTRSASRALLFDDHVGKVSLVGAGMRSHPGVAATFFAALAEAGVNIEMISTSEIRVSVVCRDTDLDEAVRAVHDAFELGGAEEAVVYAGTGR